MRRSLSHKKTPRRANPTNKKPLIFSYGSARSSRSAPLNRSSENAAPASNKPSAEKRISKIINYIIAGILVCGAIYMCLLTPNAQIKISGEKIYPRDKSSYEQQINRQLSSSIFYRTKITFDSSKLQAQIKQKFPEINNIDIKISPLRHRPVIEVTLAKPVAKLVTRDKTYILDEEGRALFEQKYASSVLNKTPLLTISDDSGHDIEIGKTALTEQQIGFIREVIGQTSAKELKPQSFALSSGGTAVDARFEGLGYFVKFNFDSSARQSSGAFIALQEQLKKEGHEPKQYIDLRIPDKAFVK